MSRMLKAARYYAQIDWPVIPLHSVKDGRCTCNRDNCNSPGKHPMTRHGVKDASTDLDVVARWWKRWPDANVGVATGGAVGVVLDVDGPAGEKSLQELIALNGALPDTIEAVTGSGGRHILFEAPSIAIRNKVRFAPGLDVRTDGGYIVVTPSVHTSGQDYTWKRSPREAKHAAAPKWLTDLMTEDPQEERTRQQRQLPSHSRDDEKPDADRVSSALEVLDPDCDHEMWRKVGMALHSWDASQGLEIWDAWSSKGSKYPGRKGIERKWRSFNGSGITEKTLFGFARDAGWKPAPTQRKEQRSTSTQRKEERAQKREVREKKQVPFLTKEHRQALIWTTTNAGVTKPLNCVANAVIILAYDTRWGGIIARDTFGHVTVKKSPPPWDDYDKPGEEFVAGDPWSDQDDTRASTWLHRNWQMKMGRDATREAVEIVAEQNAIHPVRAYLEALEWDAVPRLDVWLSEYVGAADNEYNRNVGRWWLISAVARIFMPGCKADHVIILEGEQGIRKSSALKAIAGEDWFTDTPFELGNKEGVLAMRGKWIIELAELDALGRAAASRAKAFFSSDSDRVRELWGRRYKDQKRQCVFAGTVNPEGGGYLKDPTGARRYWPVRCGRIDLNAIRDDRDQLWAEAVVAFHKGDPWYPQNVAESSMLQAEQAERYQGDEWEDSILMWLRGQVDHSQVTLGEVLGDALRLPKGQWGRTEQMRAAACLQRLGFEQKRVKQRRFYVSTDPSLIGVRVDPDCPF